MATEQAPAFPNQTGMVSRHPWPGVYGPLQVLLAEERERDVGLVGVRDAASTSPCLNERSPAAVTNAAQSAALDLENEAQPNAEGTLSSQGIHVRGHFRGRDYAGHTVLVQQDSETTVFRDASQDSLMPQLLLAHGEPVMAVSRPGPERHESALQTGERGCWQARWATLDQACIATSRLARFSDHAFSDQSLAAAARIAEIQKLRAR
jgi:hypothetical protein